LGRCGRGKKVSWVKWEVVCKQKRNGGLGVKDIRVMNVSLLAKWHWRLLDGEKALWKDVLEVKYGPCVGTLLEGGSRTWPRHSSCWWKELNRIGDFGGERWFNSEVSRRVGNGLNTSFWNVKWCGERCFRLKYPRLFMISSQKEVLVGEVGVITNLGRVWRFNWRRHLFVWEEELLLSLMEDLEGMMWSSNEDVWRWNLEEKGVFSVKSAYGRLEVLVGAVDDWGDSEKRVFVKLWKNPAPSKVTTFAWKVLLNRIPTKTNLALRNILSPKESTLCVMCNMVEESSNHLFMHCNVASLVWSKLMWWLNEFFVIPHNLFFHWECWCGRETNKNVLKGLRLIWLSTIWVLWKGRNDKNFKGSTFEVDDLVEEVKVLSWRWMLYRMNLPVCLYYE
jgi:hypothetical protein